MRKPAIRPTRAIRASCRAGAASGHATAPQPSSVLNSRRFIANSVPGVLNASVGIFSARVQADGCPNWVTLVEFGTSAAGPVYPDQRKSSDLLGWVRANKTLMHRSNLTAYSRPRRRAQ